MLVFPWHAIFQVNIPFSLLHVQEGAGNIPSGFEGDIHSLYFPVFLLCCLTPRGHNLSKESCYHRGKPSLEWVEWFSFLEGVLSFIIKSLSPEKGYVVQTEYNSETGENFEVISLHPSLTHHWESCLKSLTDPVFEGMRTQILWFWSLSIMPAGKSGFILVPELIKNFLGHCASSPSDMCNFCL